MKILHVISSGGMYGAEAVILNLIRTLNREGHTGILGIFSNSANPNLQLHEIAQAEGIESHLISCRGQLDRTVPSSIRTIAASLHVDIVHAHGYKADVYSYFAMRGSPIALVSTCHNWLDADPFVRLYGEIDRRVLRRYNAIIAVSEEVKSRLLKSRVSPYRVHLIQNGLDLRPFQQTIPSLHPHTSPESLMVGWIGRLSPEKGPDLFVQAAATVHLELPNVQFFLVGDGPDRPQLETLIAELHAGEYVHLVGRRTDMPAVYASFDVLVSASRREGLPMAILEGMASGLPWIATSVGDVPKVVIDGQTGFITPPGDTDQLAHALVRLLANQPLRSQMGAAAKHRVQAEFSAEKMTSEYLQVYEQASTFARNRRGGAQQGLRSQL